VIGLVAHTNTVIHASCAHCALSAFSSTLIPVKRTKTLIVVLVAVVFGAIAGYYWNSYRSYMRWRKEALSQLEQTHKWAEGQQAFLAIRQEELECAQKLIHTGDSFSHAWRVCHEQRNLEWQNWARSYPDLAKKLIDDRAIVQATE
jgi:hypothetical protein